MREKKHMMGFVELFPPTLKIALSRRFRAFTKMVRKSMRFKISKNPFRGGFFIQKVLPQKFFFEKFWNAPFLEPFEVGNFTILAQKWSKLSKNGQFFTKILSILNAFFFVKTCFKLFSETFKSVFIPLSWSYNH